MVQIDRFAFGERVPQSPSLFTVSSQSVFRRKRGGGMYRGDPGTYQALFNKAGRFLGIDGPHRESDLEDRRSLRRLGARYIIRVEAPDREAALRLSKEAMADPARRAPERWTVADHLGHAVFVVSTWATARLLSRKKLGTSPDEAPLRRDPPDAST